MSVEKMIMLDIVGHADDLEAVCKKIVLTESMHLVNAFQQISSSNFSLCTTEENIPVLLDVCYIKPYVKDHEYNDINKKMKKLIHLLKQNEFSSIREEDIILNYELIEENILKLENEYSRIYDELEGKKNERQNILKTIDYLKFLMDIDISLNEIKNLNHFDSNIYKISKENILRLKENYENIPSIVVDIFREKEYEVLLTFTPKSLKLEVDRIFRSLNGEELILPENCIGTAKETLEYFNNSLQTLNKNIPVLEEKIQKFLASNKKLLLILDKSLELELKSAEVKENTAYTNDFFYLSGWVPKSLLSKFKYKMRDYEQKLIIIEKSLNEVNQNIMPPTKLKNNFLVKPFEAIVNMYGIPSYKEIDPTMFLAITYIVIFGAMFGDLGQGLIFVLIGFILKNKKSNTRPNFGGVLIRLGISSSIFGTFYGSFFGFESVIKPIFLRPMENIMEILIAGIVFGCALLIIGFTMSLINNLKRKNIEDGIFGKNGLVGMVLYISIIIFAVTKYKGIEIMNTIVWILVFGILLLLMVLKQPLANLINGEKELYREKKSDYYVEGTFGIMETLISMFSNTLSFIRVGAFAINHVGLFLAFAALANMTSSKIGSTVIYVVANIVILGLEGLVVFIQGLRLQYYELFSKYYEGGGVSFNPIRIEQNKNFRIEGGV